MIEMESRLLSQLCRAEVPRDSVLRRDERGMKKLCQTSLKRSVSSCAVNGPRSSWSATWAGGDVAVVPRLSSHAPGGDGDDPQLIESLYSIWVKPCSGSDSWHASRGHLSAVMRSAVALVVNADTVE